MQFDLRQGGIITSGSVPEWERTTKLHVLWFQEYIRLSGRVGGDVRRMHKRTSLSIPVGPGQKIPERRNNIIYRKNGVSMEFEINFGNGMDPVRHRGIAPARRRPVWRKVMTSAFSLKHPGRGLVTYEYHRRNLKAAGAFHICCRQLGFGRRAPDGAWNLTKSWIGNRWFLTGTKPEIGL